MNVKMEELSAVNNEQLQVDRCLLSIGSKDWRRVRFICQFFRTLLLHKNSKR